MRMYLLIYAAGIVTLLGAVVSGSLSVRPIFQIPVVTAECIK
jgi:hypothetical protein